MKHKEYEISAKTLRDIINQVPSDKWTLVMRDMSAMLEQSKAVVDLISATGQVVIGDEFKVSDILQLQETITWVDDGKCENEIGFIDEEGNDHGAIKFGKEVTYSKR